MIIKCPHCDDFIEIIELNCKIFRHAVYKNNMIQINPHASKDECDNLRSKDLIYGCARPFKIDDTNKENIKAIICDYI